MAFILNLILPLAGFFTPLFFLTITADFFSLNKITLLVVISLLAIITLSIQSLMTKKLTIPLNFSLTTFFLATVFIIFSLFFFSPNAMHRLVGLTLTVSALTIIYFTSLTSSTPGRIVSWTISALGLSASLASIYTLLSVSGVTTSLSDNILSNPNFHPAGNIYFGLVFLISVIGLSLASIFITNGKARIFHIVTSSIITLGIITSIYHIANQETRIQFMPLQASWSIAVDIFKFPQTAFFGTSPDSYANTFTRLRPGYLNLNPDIWPVRFITARSEALTLLTTTGLLGFGFVALALFGALRSLVNHLKTDPTSRAITISFVISLIIFSVLPTGFIGYFALFVHLILASLHIRSLSPRAPFLNLGFAASTEEVGSLKNPALPIFFTLASVVLTILIGLRLVPIYQANIYFKTAQDIASTNPGYSYELQVKSANTDPYNPYYRLNLSQTYFSIVRGYVQKQELTEDEQKEALEFANQSIVEARNATSLDPLNVQVWENLANLAVEYSLLEIQGASDLAIASFNQAISLDPSSPSLRVQLGNYFFNLGDYDSALKTFEIAMIQKPDWDIPYLNSSKAYKAKEDYPRALLYLREGIKYTPSDSEQAPELTQELAELTKLVGPEATQSAELDTLPVPTPDTDLE
jgi:tetratricopeptide (TPR) repeat protein